MARGKKPSVRYWKSRGGYCCWIGSTQHILAKGDDDAPNGPTYLAAHARFKKLIEQDANKGTNDYLISALLNAYRAHLKASRKSATPGIFEVMARGFAAEFGKLKVCELQPYMMEEWLRKQDNWNDTSKAHAGQLILAAVSWASRKGFISHDPLKGRVDLPTPVLRGREARMSEELMDLLISEASQNQHKSTEFAEFMTILRESGARPGEIRNAEAHNYQNGKIIFRWNATIGHTWKNAKKTQRDRVIFLTPSMQEHVERLVKLHPEGAIFRTPRGAKWSLTSLSNKLTWLRKRKKVAAYFAEHDIAPESVVLYNFRHSWACNYLDTTGDVFGCALMMGTSVKMLQQRYFHMDMEKLHSRYLEFMGGKTKTAV